MSLHRDECEVWTRGKGRAGGVNVFFTLDRLRELWRLGVCDVGRALEGVGWAFADLGGAFGAGCACCAPPGVKSVTRFDLEVGGPSVRMDELLLLWERDVFITLGAWICLVHVQCQEFEH